MLTNLTAYKYQIPYKGPFLITQCLPMAWLSDKLFRQKLRIIYVALGHINLILKLNILVEKYV